MSLFKELQEVYSFLDEKFPHGHETFNDLMVDQMRLHSQKNQQYAGGGDALGNFNRVASLLRIYQSFPPNKYSVTMMYFLKHFDKVMLDITNGNEPSDESLGDMAVYATLMRCMLKDDRA